MRIMAIRFQCGACSQPIEVDDKWALKAVACPYCRKTITAPSESTLGDLSRIPMATPLLEVGGAVALRSPSPGAFTSPSSNANPPAVAAFILAAAMVLFLLLSMMIVASHPLELEQFQKELQPKSGADAQTQVQSMMRYIDAHGGQFPGWLLAMVWMWFFAMAAYPAAIVCGLLALRRRARRPMAIIALVSCGFVTLWFCLNLLAGFMGVGLHR